VATPAADSRGPTIALSLLLAAIVLPVDARWIDVEATRTALAGVLVALSAIGLALTRGLRGFRGAVPLAVLLGYGALRAFEPIAELTNTGLAHARFGWYASLALAVVIGARVSVLATLRAGTIVALLLGSLTVLQQFGLAWPFAAAGPGQTVATLGNRNAVSEALAVGLGLALALRAVTPIARTRHARLTAVAAIAIALALGVSGSRSGLLAAGFVLAIFALAPGTNTTSSRRTRIGLALAGSFAVALGGLLRGGFGETRQAPTPPSSTAVAAPSTVELRFALWRGVIDLIEESPVFGQGLGQLRVEYPRHRSQAEIEASSFGRRFVTAVESAHDDHLEVIVEAGIVGMLLLGVTLWALARGARALELLPLFAFLAVAIVRAPLGNAAAAVPLALCLGALSARAGSGPPATGRFLPTVAVPLAVLILMAAWPDLRGAQHVATWLDGGATTELDRAVELSPHEPRYRTLRIIDRCGGQASDGTLNRRGTAEWNACAADLDALLECAPNHTEALYLRAQLAHGAGRREQAAHALRALLALDPHEPRAQMLSAVLLFDDGKVPEAIATLYARPHPRLRERLAAMLGTFAQVPGVRTEHRLLLTREEAFVRALDAVLAQPAASDTELAVSGYASSVPANEPRLLSLRARVLQARDEAKRADALAPASLSLSRAERALLSAVLSELARELPTWRRVIGALDSSR
jgi:O-antigen ligase